MKKKAIQEIKEAVSDYDRLRMLINEAVDLSDQLGDREYAIDVFVAAMLKKGKIFAPRALLLKMSSALMDNISINRK